MAAFAALFLGVAVVSVFAALAAVLLITTDLAPVHAAGILAVLAVVLGAFVPSLAFRMSGMRMPPLPTNAQQLQEGIEPHATSVVSARAILADGWMTSLYGAVGVVGAGCLVTLARERELAEVIMTVALSLLLILHARGLGNIWQRMSLVVPGVAGLLLLVLVAAPAASPGYRLVTAAGLLAATAALAIAAWTVPGQPARAVLGPRGGTAALGPGGQRAAARPVGARCVRHPAVHQRLTGRETRCHAVQTRPGTRPHVRHGPH